MSGQYIPEIYNIKKILKMSEISNNISNEKNYNKTEKSLKNAQSVFSKYVFKGN